MKLPDDKKERQQMLILMGIVAAAAIYAVVNFVLLPFISSQREIPEKLEGVRDQLATGERTLAAVPRNIEQYNVYVTNIRRTVDQYLLQPVLGSYILEAERIIEQHALAVGLTIDGFREDGIRDLPVARTRQGAGAGNRLRSYALIVNLRAGYDDMVRLIEAIEAGNPFVSVLELNLNHQPRTPQIHAVQFKVLWPIWGGNEELPTFHPESSEGTQ